MFAVDTNSVRGILDSIGLVLFYGFAFWRIFKGNPGNKVIECGSITLMVFVVALALFKAKFPAWVLGWLFFLVFLLCLLTMFFLVQQAYRAVRRRKTG
jgi:hypothetical protein